MRFKLAALSGLFALAFGAGAPSVAAAEITLIRGAFVETVPVGWEGGPAVLRGARPLPVEARATPAPSPVAALPARPVVTAGDTLWVLEPSIGRLQACWLRGTGIAGQNRIHCTTAD